MVQNPRKRTGGKQISAARAVVSSSKRWAGKLPGWISVRHRDGDRANNTAGNLQLWIGPVRGGIPANDLTCPHCGRRYIDGL